VALKQLLSLFNIIDIDEDIQITNILSHRFNCLKSSIHYPTPLHISYQANFHFIFHVGTEFCEPFLDVIIGKQLNDFRR
jgi:hypothetical protein